MQHCFRERPAGKGSLLIGMIFFASAFIEIMPGFAKQELVFSSEILEVLSGNERETFQGGLDTYFGKYGPSVHEKIFVGKAPKGDWVEYFPDGSKESTLAVSVPGRIEIVAENFTFNPDKEQLKGLRNQALHEATHACKPEKKLFFERPIKLADGTDAFGIHGFCVLGKLPNGEETGFRLIEEGVAEMLAANAEKGYSVQSSKYFRLGDLSILLVNSLEISPEEVQNHIEENDLWWFVNRILGRNPHSRDPNDLIRIMTAYQKVWKEHSVPKAIARALLNLK